MSLFNFLQFNKLIHAYKRGLPESFMHRFIKIYLPVLLIGLGIILYPSLAPPAATAAPAVAPSSVHPVEIAVAAPASPVTPPVIRSTPACSPDTQFQPAGQFTASANGSALTQLIDQPYAHKIYGYTSEQMKALSYKCPLVVPGDSEQYINAYTTYWLGWNAEYSVGDDGQCRVSNPRVLLHIRQALPSWQNSSGASPQLAAAWSAYSAAVNNHESGHVKLDQDYAGQLLNNLQNFPATSCDSITQAVSSMSSNLISRLDQANNGYDEQTRHGELQAAIIP